jgi:hypothetical protein
MTPAEALVDLARRVARLSPDRRDPERFFEERSDLVAELRKLAREQSSVSVCKYPPSSS